MTVLGESIADCTQRRVKGNHSERAATLWENRRRNTALNKHEHITLHKITAIYFLKTIKLIDKLL